MENNENNEKKKRRGSPQNLIPFKKGFDERRLLTGRPRKLITNLKETGYKVSEIKDVIQVMVAMTNSQLEKIKENPNSTALEKMISTALIRGSKYGQLDVMETLLTRAQGKPVSKTESDITITGTSIKLNFGEEEDNG